MTYDLGSCTDWFKNVGTAALKTARGKKMISATIHSLLLRKHGNSGLLEIWKEAEVFLDDDCSKNYICVFHAYDNLGHYFDWV